MFLIVLVFKPIAESFTELDTLMPHLLLLFLVELVAFTKVANVAPSFLDVTIPQALLINLFKLAKFFWNLSIRGVLHGFYQICGCSTLVWRDERDGMAFVTGATRAPHSMHIVFEMIRADEVDDQSNVLDVEASSTDRGRDKDVTDTQLEVLNRELPIRLVHSTVQYE